MARDPRKWNRRDALIFSPLFILPILFIVLDCSGLLFPVVGKQASLVNGITHDLGITVPASLHVEHAARLATRDPAYFYACSIDPADIPAFVALLKAASYYDESASQSDKRFSMEKTPAWYDPGSAPDVSTIKFDIPAKGDLSASGYWFFLSPSAHKVWVYWFST
ncbi:MAG TPA: hypothetical protein VHQ47_15515 [Phycisphaerae bacterium]|nr:hypothetical protein [Phycisphaerae bacterium]